MFNVVDLRRIDLNLLVVFATVFRERSVKRAASRLLVGQSAVSMALGRLRDLLNDDLFVKVATGVAPTPKAVAIEPHVHDALELLHAAVYEAGEFDPARASRVLRVGLSSDLEVWLLPALFDELQRVAPGITVVVRASHWYTGLSLVEQSEADVVLGILPKASSSLFAETLYRERFVSLFDSEHVTAPLTMTRFLATPHVMVSVSGDLTGLVDEALRGRGKERRVVATVPDFTTLGPLVRGRRLIATLPSAAAAHLAHALGLATATPPVTVGEYPVSMIWHAKTDRDPALRWFRGMLRELVLRTVPVSALAQGSPEPRQRRAPTRRRR